MWQFSKIYSSYNPTFTMKIAHNTTLIIVTFGMNMIIERHVLNTIFVTNMRFSTVVTSESLSH